MSNRPALEDRCDHLHLVCPEHNGAFDCNSFCSTCEGNQEYCPNGCEMVYDDETGDIIYVKEHSNR